MVLSRVEAQKGYRLPESLDGTFTLLNQKGEDPHIVTW